MKFLKEQYQIESTITEDGMLVTSKIIGADSIPEDLNENVLVCEFSNELSFNKAKLRFQIKPTRKLFWYLKRCLEDGSLRLGLFDKARLITTLVNQLRYVFSGLEYHKQRRVVLDLWAQNQRAVNGGYVRYLGYADIIKNLCMLGKTHDAVKFQKKTGSRILGVQDTENFIRIYRAHILFTEGKYAESLEMVSNCFAESVWAGVDIRMLKIKIAFKQKEQTMLVSHVNSFRKFMTTAAKGNFNAQLISSRLAEVKYIFKLSKILGSRSDQFTSLRNQIENDATFYDKFWIL